MGTGRVMIRINTRGFIPEVNGHGPIRQMLASIDKIKELAANGRDIVLLNTTVFPELGRELDAIRAEAKREKLSKASNVKTGHIVLDGVSRDTTKMILDDMSKQQNTIAAPFKDATMSALQQAGIVDAVGDVSTPIIEEEASNEYMNKLNIIDNAVDTPTTEESSSIDESQPVNEATNKHTQYRPKKKHANNG